MAVALITGSGGLIGSESARFFHAKGFDVVGVDNDMRAYFFGAGASTGPNAKRLERELAHYSHVNCDIRDAAALEAVFHKFGEDIRCVVHAAAQPSHDWAAREPLTDFGVNAQGTLHVLEATRKFCPEAVFIFTSTNKVYGDTPNKLPLVELDTRWELQTGHRYSDGVDESMSVDQTTHSIFGVSKLAADMMVQEYGRYFGMKTVCFRGGCLTGPAHAGTELHGFLAYLMKCTVTGRPYSVFGYKGKQVRDNIHCHDLVNAFWHFFNNPRSGQVYNIGGSRFANCSMLEAIELCERLSARKLAWSYREDNRVGDHVWWVSGTRKFQSHYPEWRCQYDLPRTLAEIHEACVAPC